MPKGKKKNKHIGVWILTIVLIAILGFCTYWIVANFETVKASFNGTKLYTQKEVQDAYNQGLEDKQGFETQINDWMSKYEDAQNKLNNAKENIAQLQESVTTKDNAIKENAEAIKQLQAQISELEVDANYYKVLIEQYKSLNERVVTFYLENELLKSNIVQKGESVTEVPIIENNEHLTFKGWSIDGTTIVEPTEIEINEDTRFVAIVEIKYNVTFTYKDAVIKSGKVLKGNNAVAPTEALEGLQGWSIDGKTIVDLSNYEITADTTFIAIYKIEYVTTVELNEDLVINKSNSFNVEGLKATSNFELTLGRLRILDTYDWALPIHDFNGVIENGKKLVFAMGENSIEITATCLKDGVMTINYAFVGPAIAEDFNIKIFRFDEIKIKN